MKVKIISAIAVLAFSGLACGFNIDLPRAAAPGALVTDKISVPLPESGEAHLKLAFGAGEMKVSPGSEKGLVEGTAKYNHDQFKPVVKIEGSDASIQMGDVSLDGFLAFSDLKNEWDLKLGDAPMALVVEAGAYNAEFELGGLALTDLSISDGAANVNLSFSEPNRSEMNLFHYETGASDVKMEGLADANFHAMTFSGGAGDYTLDFSGELQRDATVNIDTGLSNMILVIPQGTHAVVNVDSGVSNVEAGPGWSQSGERYTLDGEGPTLTIVVEMGAGNLTLTK